MLLREQAHGVGIVGLVSGAEGEPSGTSETWGMVYLVYPVCLVYSVYPVGRIGISTRSTR
jgi:hypothetical protein